MTSAFLLLRKMIICKEVCVITNSFELWFIWQCCQLYLVFQTHQQGLKSSGSSWSKSQLQLLAISQFLWFGYTCPYVEVFFLQTSQILFWFSVFLSHIDLSVIHMLIFQFQWMNYKQMNFLHFFFIEASSKELKFFEVIHSFSPWTSSY